MNLLSCINICINALKKMEKGNPKGTLRIEGEGTVTYRMAVSELEKTAKWVYRDLQTENIQIVTHCKDCAHYKRYRKKGSLKPVVKCLCELDKAERKPDFFCASGIDKEE